MAIHIGSQGLFSVPLKVTHCLEEMAVHWTRTPRGIVAAQRGMTLSPPVLKSEIPHLITIALTVTSVP